MPNNISAPLGKIFHYFFITEQDVEIFFIVINIFKVIWSLPLNVRYTPPASYLLTGYFPAL